MCGREARVPDRVYPKGAKPHIFKTWFFHNFRKVRNGNSKETQLLILVNNCVSFL